MSLSPSQVYPSGRKVEENSELVHDNSEINFIFVDLTTSTDTHLFGPMVVRSVLAHTCLRPDGRSIRDTADRLLSTDILFLVF